MIIPTLFCLQISSFKRPCTYVTVVTGDMRAAVRIAILVFLYFSTQLTNVNSNSNIAKQNMRYVFCVTICTRFLCMVSVLKA